VSGAADRLRRLAGAARARRDEQSERVASRSDLRRMRRQTAGPGRYEQSERRMRVVLLAPADRPDTRRWADLYAARGIEVYAVSLEHQRDPGPARPRVRTAYLPALGRAAGRAVVSPLAVARLRALIDQARPDVVHAHQTGSYALLGALADRHPFVVSVGGTAPERLPDGVAARRLAEFVRGRADAVVPVDEGHDSAGGSDDSASWERNAALMLDVFAKLGLRGK
jgi:hypothetical protein